MDIMAFRVLVERLLHGKSKELEIKVKAKVQEVLGILGKNYISDESVALIIITQEAELERLRTT